MISNDGTHVVVAGKSSWTGMSDVLVEPIAVPRGLSSSDHKHFEQVHLNNHTFAVTWGLHWQIATPCSVGYGGEAMWHG